MFDDGLHTANSHKINQDFHQMIDCSCVLFDQLVPVKANLYYMLTKSFEPMNGTFYFYKQYQSLDKKI